MKTKFTPLLLFVLLGITSPKGFAQESDSMTSEKSDIILTDQGDNLFEMSLEDLLNVKIVSASRKEESAFEAPLSSWVITRQEISAMGATSIPDALRVCPGLLVREVSNGTYDVSIRGGIDGLPSYGYTYINSSILVMIDNRPVFSYLQGGTYWQNLPIGLAEIEKIEIINGPAAPLYGPNAVSGVINIISSRPKNEGVYANGVVMAGPFTKLISTQVGVKVSPKLSLDLALNYEDRNRYNKDFYDRSNGTYRNIDSINGSFTTTKDLRYPDVDKSLSKIGGTVNLNYKESEKLYFNLSSSINQNIGLMPLSVGLALSDFTNTSQNVYLKGYAHGFGIQTSYLSGTQGLSGNLSENNYDYSNEDYYLDYDFNFFQDKLSVRPAISYQRTYANDLKYTVDAGKNGAFNSQGSIEDMAGSLKLDAKPIEKLRVILAGRYDKFNYPQKGVFSYQGIVNFSENANNISRIVTGKSYNSSFLVPTLINKSNTSQAGPMSFEVNLFGNKNLALLSNTMYEIGHRMKISSGLILDLAVFNQTFENINTLVLTGTKFVPPSKISTTSVTENLPLKVIQNGVTLSLQSSFMNNKIQFRPNITFQQTKLKNYSPYYNNPGTYAMLNPKFTESKDNVKDVDSKTTPSIWAGFNLIIIPIEKLTFDVSCNYYDQYQMHLAAEVNNSTGVIKDQSGSQIKGKTLVNLNTTYKLHKQLSASLNIRNILNQSAPEGFGSDKLGRSILLGLNFNY